MKKILSLSLIVCLITFSIPRMANAATTKAQTGVAGSALSGTTVTCTFANNPAAGSLITVGILFYDGGTTAPTWSVQDANGNVYTNSPSSTGSTNMNTAGWAGQSYLLSAPANANKAITVTFNKATAAAAMWCDNFTPTAGLVATFDNSAVANGSSAVTTPTIPVAGANELVYSTVTNENDSGNPTGAWTRNEAGNIFGNGSAWILDVSAATAVGWTGSGGQVYNAIGMSFKFISSAATYTGPINHYINGVEYINGTFYQSQ